MNNTKKIAIGLGIAGGALLAAWLLTGDRRKKTKDFITKKVKNMKDALNDEGKKDSDDADVHYV